MALKEEIIHLKPVPTITTFTYLGIIFLLKVIVDNLEREYHRAHSGHKLTINKSFLFSAMKKYKPTDATTNPSLILQAATMPQYQHLINKAVEFGKQNGK